ncbi:MAG: hypothetical protein K6G63_10680 [Eubacterium sp.]|nr:hypothetical protein [Eubacterium sp.]
MLEMTNWRVGLSNLIPAAIGLVFVTVMMIKSQGEFEVTVQKTKRSFVGCGQRKKTGG